VLLLVAACNDDPRLEVVVRHPDGDTTLRAAIARTTVTVYESPTLTCGAVELGEIDAQPLDALATAEVTLADGVGTLEDVARVEHKVIVARSFDVAGTLVAIGCGEADDVALGPVEITTELAATVSVALDDEGGILVAATDAFSRPLEGRAVTWRAFGPAGARPADRYVTVSDGVWEPTGPSCTVDGEVTIHPGPPTVPGGFAVQTRVAWAANPTPLVTRFAGFDRQAAEAVSLGVVIDPIFPIARRCGVHRSATGTAMVCLADNREVVTIRAQGATYVASRTTLASPVVALLSVPRGGQRFTYVVGPAGNWTPLLDSPAVPAGTNPWCGGGGPCPPDEDVQEIQVVPPCGSADAVVVARLGDGVTSHLEVANVVGVPGTDVTPFPAPVTGAGCLTELQPDGTPLPRQGLVLGMTTETTSRAVISFPCAATGGTCQLPVNQGAGFVTRGEPQLVVTTFDATGVTLSSVVAQPTGNLSRDRFIERSRQPAAGIPVQMVSGRFDEDDEADLFWYFAPQFGTGTNIQVAYGRTVEGSPLTALGNIIGSIEDAFAADLDGNGLDELIVLQSTDLLVVKTGATIDVVTREDSVCE
jgi:hypothetical protein